MKTLVIAAMLLAAATIAASAQEPIPDIKGTWTGKGKVIVFGAGPHHPGAQTHTDPPRVREIQATHVVVGQDGRVAWGHSGSAVADNKEPFAWAISNDNRTIMGADVDGYFRISLLTPDRMEKCYVQNGVSPSRAVVATCYFMDRVKK